MPRRSISKVACCAISSSYPSVQSSILALLGTNIRSKMAAAMKMSTLSGPSQARLGQGSFRGTQLRPISVTTARRPARITTKAAQPDYPTNWLNKNPLVPVLAFFGWTLPTNIPVPILGGKSLFGEFLGTIGSNLAHFPKGPALTDRFWLYFAIYHVGLFTTLLLGQIGVNGRKQGYW